MSTILGKVTNVKWLTTSSNGNPQGDVTLERVDGTTGTYRTMSDASIAYDVENPIYADSVHAFALTDAGRIRGEDVYATSAYNRLASSFPRGSTVHTAVTHVSSSGMSRHIMVLGVDAGRDIDNVSAAVARILGWKTNRAGDAIVVSGAGMDMGFHTVYTLAHRLYGDASALANQHV